MKPSRLASVAILQRRAAVLVLALPIGFAWVSSCSSDNSVPPAAPSADGSVDAVAPGSDSGRVDSGGVDSGGVDSGPVDSGLHAEDAANPFSSNYSDPTMWLCGAMAKHDYCLDVQSATEIKADGTQVDASAPPATSTKIDCFYVYPTVDMSMTAGNRQTFDNLPDILDPLLGQAAPFSQVCSVFAPLYHQATIGTYQDPKRDQYLDAAYADVLLAFRYYIDHLSNGRKFVLMGHSQGSHMLRRLISREVETNPSLLSRMVLALAIGAVGDLVVPKGAIVGGSFASVPLCTTADQTGCVITFNSFASGHPPLVALLNPDASTLNAPCTNPGALDGGLTRLAGSVFPTKVHQAVVDPGSTFPVTSALAVYGDFFTGECKPGPTGLDYFEVAPAPDAGDTRTNPINFDSGVLSPGAPFYLGTHLLDYTFPMKELIEAVRTRASKL
jgi:hypothetical protein